MTDEEQAAKALELVTFLDDAPPPPNFERWVVDHITDEHDEESEPC